MGKYLNLRDFSEYKLSAWALIAANAVPLFGVLFLGWDAFAIIALYWVENVIIGMVNVLKMITCNPDPAEIAEAWSKSASPEQLQEMQKALKAFSSNADKTKFAHYASKLFFIPFFILHYGLFCMVHGAFILVLFGPNSFGGSPLDVVHGLLWDVARDRHLGWAVAGLAGSHLFSFFRNYLGNGEYRRTMLPMLMIQPYARVVVLHLAILLGAFAVFALGSNIGVLVILIVGKTILDLSLHLRERERNAQPEVQILPEVILGEAGQTTATPVASGQSHPPARSSSGD
jgi:hypothetical protein